MSEKKVYSAITKAMAQIAKSGISKDRKNQQQGYSFRGIDDVYNALSSVLSDNGLVILPRVLSREVTERQTKGGSALFYVVLAVEFDIVCSEDGSSHTVKTYGEAMDSADKATNKAMSAAYKYMAMEVFCIPTEGDNDADSHTHEVTAAFKLSDWENKIKATTTKEAAKAVYNEATAICKANNDVTSFNALKAVLIAHGAFIDAANKETAEA